LASLGDLGVRSLNASRDHNREIADGSVNAISELAD
jgi:hypothetical protein